MEKTKQKEISAVANFVDAFIEERQRSKNEDLRFLKEMKSISGGNGFVIKPSEKDQNCLLSDYVD